MNSAKTAANRNDIQSSFSILLAESNSILREKIAGLLTRQEKVWCVVQVSGREELLRGAANIQPDFILASVSILNDQETIDSLKNSAPSCRIIALAESVSDPYREAITRLGLEDVIETTAVSDFFTNVFIGLET